MEEILKKTVTVTHTLTQTQTITDGLPFPEPTTTTTSSVAPIPTVIPGGHPTFQNVDTAGKRTLWYGGLLPIIRTVDSCWGVIGLSQCLWRFRLLYSTSSATAYS